MRRSTSIRLVLGAGIALALAAGCGRVDNSARAARSQGAKQVADTAGQPASRATPGRTAEIPNDPCDWLPVSEVEEVLGKLAAPRERTGSGCRYPVVPDSALLERRARRRELARRLGEPAASSADTSWKKAFVIVTVDVSFDAAAARASALAASSVSEMLARAAANSPMGDSVQRARAKEGWDVISGAFSTFEGRVGHLRVIVSEDNMMDRLVTFEKKIALAAKVRDRIPDLPFVNPNGDASPDESPDGDPCSLITRDEAESVLGPLVVDPYRIGKAEPFVQQGGASCGYFTKQHHVLILTPHWSGGKLELGLNRGVGNLISVAAPGADGAAADTLEGPWDEALVGLDGSLLFVSGDRLLRVSYATASVEAAQAVKLARIAVGRLAASRSP